MAASAMASQKLLNMGTKIIGVGRNYVAHAKELGNAVPKVFALWLLPPFNYISVRVPRKNLK